MENTSQPNDLAGTINTTYLYITLFMSLVLSLLYGYTTFYSLFRLKIYTVKSVKVLSGKILYSVLGLGALIATVLNILQSVYSIQELNTKSTTEDQVTKFSYYFITSQDLIFWLIFLMLYWQLLILWHQGHLHFDNILEKTTCIPYSKTARYLFLVIGLSFFIGSITIMFYLGFQPSENQKNTEMAFNYFLATLCFVIPIYLFVTEIYFILKYSGCPYTSRTYQKRIQYANKICIFIAVTRMLEGVILIMYNQYYDQVNGISLNQNQTFIILIFFAYLAIVITIDILPIMMLLNISTVKIFTEDYEVDSEAQNNLEENLFEQNDRSSRVVSRGSLAEDALIIQRMIKKSNSDEVDQFDLEQINLNDIDFDQTKNLQRPKGLGAIRVFRVNQAYIRTSLILREIDIKDLPIYQLEDIRQEIQIQKKIRSNDLLRLRYVAQQNSTVSLISEYCPNGSLANLIGMSRLKDSKSLKSFLNAENNNLIKFNDNGTISFKSKIRIALNIAEALRNLHSLEPPVYHGHLSSHNILFNQKWNIKISDLGLIQLKKFLGIKLGYTNKSEFTCPEHLEERGNVVSCPTAEGDKYSYGFILYHLFTDQEPFKDLQLKDIKRIVLQEHTRPKIPDTIYEEIATLIRSFWQQDKALRPSFDFVINILKGIEENHQE